MNKTFQVINDIFKIILNILLVLISFFSVVVISRENGWLEVVCRILISATCLAAVFCKKYRYLWASIALTLIAIACILHTIYI